jgi:hypothetical protein
MRQPQFTQNLLNFEYCFKAQLYWQSLFAEMLETMTVALLDLYALHEATPLESNSICVMSLKAAKARNGMGISTNLHKFKYCSKANKHWQSLFSEMLVTMMVALLALEILREATPIYSKTF